MFDANFIDAQHQADLSPCASPGRKAKCHHNKPCQHRKANQQMLETYHQDHRTSPLLHRTVWIDAALDLRDALLMPQDHRRHGNRATYDDGHNRHQQSTQTDDRID
jgi:hypothetical protein